MYGFSYVTDDCVLRMMDVDDVPEQVRIALLAIFSWYTIVSDKLTRHKMQVIIMHYAAIILLLLIKSFSICIFTKEYKGF